MKMNVNRQFDSMSKFNFECLRTFLRRVQLVNIETFDINFLKFELSILRHRSIW